MKNKSNDNSAHRAALLADDTYPYDFLVSVLSDSKYTLMCKRSAYVVTGESPMKDTDGVWVNGFIMEKTGNGTDAFSGRQKWAIKFSPIGMPLSEAEKFIGPYEVVPFCEALDLIWPKGPAISHQQHG